MTQPTKQISWRSLEALLPLDELPTFHRAFLVWRGLEDAEALPLRRVQQRVEAELNKWVLAGDAHKTEDDVWVNSSALTGFAAAEPWLAGLPTHQQPTEL